MLDRGIMQGLITLVTLLTFIGICWWAYRPANRDRFEADGWMAFDDDELDVHHGETMDAREGEAR